MFIDFKSILYMTTRDSKVMISLQANNLNIFLKKKMCQKSNIDTTIGFVKIFKKQHSLENYSEK